SRGQARAYKLEFEAARADYDRALQLRPTMMRAFLDRGWLKQITNDLPGSKADFEEAIRLAPDAPQWALQALALTKGLMGDRAGARADLTRALELEPGDAYRSLWLVALGGEPSTLKKLAQGSEWTSAIARYYLGKMTFAELLEE